jgi:hypothetical protein
LTRRQLLAHLIAAREKIIDMMARDTDSAHALPSAGMLATLANLDGSIAAIEATKAAKPKPAAKRGRS